MRWIEFSDRKTLRNRVKQEGGLREGAARTRSKWCLKHWGQQRFLSPAKEVIPSLSKTVAREVPPRIPGLGLSLPDSTTQVTQMRIRSDAMRHVLEVMIALSNGELAIVIS